MFAQGKTPKATASGVSPSPPPAAPAPGGSTGGGTNGISNPVEPVLSFFKPRRNKAPYSASGVLFDGLGAGIF